MSIFKKIITGIAVIAWILICGEVFLRVISAVTPFYSIEMLRYAKALKIENKNPKISHAHKVDSSANLMGVEITLNSLGHRSDELESLKEEGEKRLFVLGDSIALGWGVARGDVFVDNLEERLNEEKGSKTGFRFVTINSGIGNYNTFYKVELFKEQIKVVDPDLVVLQYYINDAEKNAIGGGGFLLKHSLLIASIHYYISIFSQEKKTLAEYYAEIYKDESEGWKNAKKSIEELKLICKKKQIPLIALLIPDFHYLSTDNPLLPIYAKIQHTFDQNQIPMLNTFPEIYAEFGNNPKKAWVARDDPHPNKKVHQIISDLLYNFIDEQKLY